jgi:hypothetical protein
MDPSNGAEIGGTMSKKKPRSQTTPAHTGEAKTHPAAPEASQGAKVRQRREPRLPEHARIDDQARAIKILAKAGFTTDDEFIQLLVESYVEVPEQEAQLRQEEKTERRIAHTVIRSFPPFSGEREDWSGSPQGLALFLAAKEVLDPKHAPEINCRPVNFGIGTLIYLGRGKGLSLLGCAAVVKAAGVDSRTLDEICRAFRRYEKRSEARVLEAELWEAEWKAALKAGASDLEARREADRLKTKSKRSH